MQEVRTFPWREEAVAVRRASAGNEAQIIIEDRLQVVARMLARMPAKERAHVRVSLPNRNKMPFFFEGGTLNDLIVNAG